MCSVVINHQFHPTRHLNVGTFLSGKKACRFILIEPHGGTSKEINIGIIIDPIRDLGGIGRVWIRSIVMIHLEGAALDVNVVKSVRSPCVGKIVIALQRGGSRGVEVVDSGCVVRVVAEKATPKFIAGAAGKFDDRVINGLEIQAMVSAVVDVAADRQLATKVRLQESTLGFGITTRTVMITSDDGSSKIEGSKTMTNQDCISGGARGTVPRIDPDGVVHRHVPEGLKPHICLSSRRGLNGHGACAESARVGIIADA